MISYQSFYYAISKLKKFMKEQKKLDEVLKVISPSGNAVCEFGNEFIDDYIKLLEESTNDDSGWISWFVFENEFGAKGLEVKTTDGKCKIKSEKSLYNICLKGNL